MGQKALATRSVASNRNGHPCVPETMPKYIRTPLEATNTANKNQPAERNRREGRARRMSSRLPMTIGATAATKTGAVNKRYPGSAREYSVSRADADGT